VDRLWVLRASGNLLRPDLTVFLDVPEGARQERMSARGSAERYEAEALQDALTRSYRESIDLLKTEDHDVVGIDGAGPEEAVCKAILAELDALP
jgi:thymidylate kinase